MPRSTTSINASRTRLFVLVSGGLKSSYEALAPSFETAAACQLIAVPGPSEGTTQDTIPRRLARGEPADVLLMVGQALDLLVKQDQIASGSKVDIARSAVGVAVRAGTAVPDISTEDALRQTLLGASSIAYSDSASGDYVRTSLFRRLDIEAQVEGKAHQIRATPVGRVVAQGDAEIGFQEVAELLPIDGVTFVGRLPAKLELLTTYSAAVATRSTQPVLARRLIRHLASAQALPTLLEKGLDPLSAQR